MKDQLETFAAIDADKNGFIKLQDYAQYYNLPICTPLKTLFSSIDIVSAIIYIPITLFDHVKSGYHHV